MNPVVSDNPGSTHLGRRSLEPNENRSVVGRSHIDAPCLAIVDLMSLRAARPADARSPRSSLRSNIDSRLHNRVVAWEGVGRAGGRASGEAGRIRGRPAGRQAGRQQACRQARVGHHGKTGMQAGKRANSAGRRTGKMASSTGRHSRQTRGCAHSSPHPPAVPQACKQASRTASKQRKQTTKLEHLQAEGQAA